MVGDFYSPAWLTDMQYTEKAFTHGKGRAGWGHRGVAEGLLGMFQTPDSILELETKPLKATKSNWPVFCLLGVNSAVYLMRTLRGLWG